MVLVGWFWRGGVMWCGSGGVGRVVLAVLVLVLVKCWGGFGVYGVVVRCWRRIVPNFVLLSLEK